MHFHILSILGGLKEDDMIRWANSSVSRHARPTRMLDFKDLSLADGRFFLDLVDSLHPGVVNFSLVNDVAHSPMEKLSNASYAINAARRLGCFIFCLPEDIVELRSKLLLTFVGSLMLFATSQEQE
jgi:plastin-1